MCNIYIKNFVENNDDSFLSIIFKRVKFISSAGHLNYNGVKLEFEEQLT